MMMTTTCLLSQTEREGVEEGGRGPKEISLRKAGISYMLL